MSQNVLVCDIETVPDFVRFAMANDLIGKSDDEIHEAISNKFHKHIYHSTAPILIS